MSEQLGKSWTGALPLPRLMSFIKEFQICWYLKEWYEIVQLHTISDQIVGIFSVELVVQEVQEGGPIFGVSTIPDFHPHPHNMLDLKRGELPEEVLSICDKLGISYTLGAYNNLSPTHDSCKSQREGSFYAPAQVWTQRLDFWRLSAPPSPCGHWRRGGGAQEDQGDFFRVCSSLTSFIILNNDAKEASDSYSALDVHLPVW